MDRIITASAPLRGELTIPGDKSISHRAVMFGALAEGTTHITHFLRSADCLSTIGMLRALGTEIEEDAAAGAVTVHGRGLHGLRESAAVLDAGNSGTTTRLMSGILAAQPFDSRIDGDDSLRTRPMDRVQIPLSQMGAQVTGRGDRCCLPLAFVAHPSLLRAIDYAMPVASAQVKSCVLLAGLYADGVTSVTERALSRNHTELMLGAFGAEVSSIEMPDGSFKSAICPEPRLRGQEIEVPGDISSAAYFIAAALLVPGSEVLVRGVGVNPTRDGFLRVVRAMGADVTPARSYLCGLEPCADLIVRAGRLTGTTVEGAIIPTLIDELPMIAALAATADGETVIRDAAELRVKESDRIEVMAQALGAMGADITATADGFVIRGRERLTGAAVDPHLDHRAAMSLSVAALAADGETTVRDADCVRISCPTFYEDLAALGR